MKQPCIFEKVFDSLLFLLYDDSFLFSGLSNCNDYVLREGVFFFYFDPGAVLLLLSVLEGRGRVRLVPVKLVLEKYNFFLTFGLVVRRLDRVISGLLTLALVEFAGSVDFSDDFSIDVDPFLGVKLFFFKHGKMKHFVLHF